MFWFCDPILGFWVNSGFGFCDMILGFGVQGLFFLTRFLGLWVVVFHTTSGIGDLVFSHQIRVWGLGQKT